MTLETEADSSLIRAIIGFDDLSRVRDSGFHLWQYGLDDASPHPFLSGGRILVLFVMLPDRKR